MHTVVNEFSFAAQARDHQHATDLIRSFVKALQALQPRRGKDAILAHSLLWQQQVGAGQTLEDWVSGPFERELQPIRLVLSKLLRNGPYIDVRLADLEHECEIEQESVRISVKGSGIAGAAALKGCLVGIDACDNFPDCTLEIYYCEGTGADLEKLTVEHVCGPEGVKRVVRVFESHPKHDQDFPTYGVRGTPMDLKVEEATQVLNSGEELVKHDRRVYAYYRACIYVFHPHRQQQNLYHGFPVLPDELMRDNIHAYNAARKKGWIS